MRYYNIVAAAVVFTVWSGSVGVGEGRGSTCKNTLSSCGNIGNISYPFQLKGHPTPCGYMKRGLVELECDSNNRTTLYVGNMKFYVQDIRISTVTPGFDDIELWLVDASVLDSNDSCFIPHMSHSPQTYEFGDCGFSECQCYSGSSFGHPPVAFIWIPSVFALWIWRGLQWCCDV